MLGTLRRCPTSLRWNLATLRRPATSLPSSCRPQLPRTTNQTQLALVNTRHFLHNNANRSQQAAAAEAIEADIESEVAGDRPPSARDIDRATAMGRLTRFQELADEGLVDPRIIRTLTKKMRFDTMTQVQSLTVNEALKGVDVVAQAKTGTGKTIAFVLPILQNIIANDPSLAKRNLRPPRFNEKTKDIRAIIISPTRELAEQIAEETRKLVEDTGVVVQCAVGGTQKNSHLRQMQRQGCHILVGTPGRLKDILSDPYSGVSAPKLTSLTLDEADRLMDQGFWPEIQEIQELLPNRRDQDRQTLMFSATIPREVQDLARSVLKRDMHFVQTVQDNETPTHERVSQMIVTVPSFENQMPALLELCQREIEARKSDRSKKPFKAIVYFPSTAETQLASEMFQVIRQNQPSANQLTASRQQNDQQFLFPARVFEIHSRLSQMARTKAAEMFRNSESAILMSSDVTARGMDFPNVTHVVQVGLPTGRDAYIHRLGRTARAGAEGEGWLIVPSVAGGEVRERLGRLPLLKDQTLEAATVDYTRGTAEAESSMTPRTAAIYESIRSACRRLSGEEFYKTYMAMLGTHQWLRDKDFLIEGLERMAKNLWCMSEVPQVPSGLAQKLGLNRIKSLNQGFGRGPRRDTRDRPPGRQDRFGGRNGRDRDRFNGPDRFSSRDGGFPPSRRSDFGGPPSRDRGYGGMNDRRTSDRGGRDGRGFDRKFNEEYSRPRY